MLVFWSSNSSVGFLKNTNSSRGLVVFTLRQIELGFETIILSKNLKIIATKYTCN